MDFVLIINTMVNLLSKRDIKVGPIPPYFRNLAHNLPNDLPDREILYEAYMKHADSVEKGEEKSLAMYKRRSYSKKKYG